jgi:hypothetical protein
MLNRKERITLALYIMWDLLVWGIALFFPLIVVMITGNYTWFTLFFFVPLSSLMAWRNSKFLFNSLRNKGIQVRRFSF